MLIDSKHASGKEMKTIWKYLWPLIDSINIIFKMALIFDPTQVTKLHVRGTEFFGTKSKFKEFKEDVDKSRFIEITDI